MISGKRLRILLLSSAALTGCDGDNLYQRFPTGLGSGTEAPSVNIEAPTAARRVAIRDSVLVQVRVTDRDGLRSVELSGFAVRGDASLGTDERVARYESKLVQFDTTRMVSDTLLTRYLLATDDSLPDPRVYVVARATDRLGNVAADTVLISIGGRRVQIESPLSGSTAQAGTSMSVVLSASDASGQIRELRLRATGGFSRDTTIGFDPALAQLQQTILLPIPSTATGSVTLLASVVTLANDSASSAPVVVQLVPAS